MRVTIERVVVPETMDADTSGDFAGFVDVGNDCALHLWGDDDFVSAPEDELAWFRSSPFRLRLLYLARLEGEPAGRLLVTVPLEEDATTAEVEVHVIPAARRHGIGAALLRQGEELVADAGRVDIATFTQHVLSGIPSGTADSVPPSAQHLPDDADARFARAHGFRLAQVEAMSRADIPLSSVVRERLHAEVDAHACGYRLVTWQRCPDDLIDSFAAARARMLVDAPHKGVPVDTVRWDADRVRREEQRWRDAGRPPLVAAAVQETTGEVAAYTIVLVAQGSATAEQRDTLVLAAHRGHRLGLAVKLANVEALARIASHTQHVLTWNAVENEPMLAINRELGFRQRALNGIWQKSLA